MLFVNADTDRAAAEENTPATLAFAKEPQTSAH